MLYIVFPGCAQCRIYPSTRFLKDLIIRVPMYGDIGLFRKSHQKMDFEGTIFRALASDVAFKALSLYIGTLMMRSFKKRVDGKILHWTHPRKTIYYSIQTFRKLDFCAFFPFLFFRLRFFPASLFT